MGGQGSDDFPAKVRPQHVQVGPTTHNVMIQVGPYQDMLKDMYPCLDMLLFFSFFFLHRNHQQGDLQWLV